MRYWSLGWLPLVILFVALLLFRGCGFGWGGGCGTSRGWRRWRGRDDDHGREPDALEILNRRYANGEMDDEEYRRKKEEILRRA